MLLSMVSVVALAAMVKPRLFPFILGAVPVSILAFYLELRLIFIPPFWFLVLAAPAVEEILKFSATFRKRDQKSGMGAGLGFALVENALYFSIFPAEGVSILLLLAVRLFQDPLMHMTASRISVKAWKRPLFLPAAILFHGFYNLYPFIDYGRNFTAAMIWLAFLIAITAGIYFRTAGKRRATSGKAVAESHPSPAGEISQDISGDLCKNSDLNFNKIK